MTDFCCSCLPQACPELHVRSKSLHEAAVLSACLMYLSTKEAIPSQRNALGMVLFPLCFVPGQRRQERLWEGAARPRRSHAPGAPACGSWEKHWVCEARMQVGQGCVLFRQLHSVRAFGQDL